MSHTQAHLVVAAHGSRSPLACAEIEHFCEKLSVQLSHMYISCHPGFLELAIPSIPNCVSQLIADGANEVHILPYFLTSGVHVTKDTPEIVQQLSSQFPQVRFKLLPAVGLAPQMLGVVESIVCEEFSGSVNVISTAGSNGLISNQ